MIVKWWIIPFTSLMIATWIECWIYSTSASTILPLNTSEEHSSNCRILLFSHQSPIQVVFPVLNCQRRTQVVLFVTVPFRPYLWFTTSLSVTNSFILFTVSIDLLWHSFIKHIYLHLHWKCQQVLQLLFWLFHYDHTILK